MTDTPPSQAGAPSTPTHRPAVQVPDHQLLRCIGRGAYGEVWLARAATGAYRAVKIVQRNAFDHDRPFEREFEGIQRFEPISRQHETQVDVLHVGRGENCFYYVMELADDQACADATLNPDTYAPRTLKSDLLHHDRLPVRECIEIGIALARALEHLHSHGLVHRDVKPSNIIFVQGVPKLADIGLVSGLDATRSYVGTEGFAAPEGPGTIRADLYSLGKVLYEIATGKDRQDFPELPTQLRDLPDRQALGELNAVISRACRHDPKDRYRSASELRAELELLRDGQSLTARRAAQRRLRLLVQVGVVLAIAAVIRFAYAPIQRWLAESRNPLPVMDPLIPPSAQEPVHPLPDSQPLFANLDQALQGKLSEYTEVGVATHPLRAAFTEILLNRPVLRFGQEYFDAFRFTTPPEPGAEMVWALLTPRNRRFSWMITPAGVDDLERGFRTFFSDDAHHYRQFPDGTNHTIHLQAMPGKWLQPAREYLVCFKFPNPQPILAQVAIQFVPPGACQETNRASLEAALGLEHIDEEPEER